MCANKHGIENQSCPCPLIILFLLDECFSLGFDSGSIVVMWLFTGELRTVYRFCMPEEMTGRIGTSGGGFFKKVGNFLVYHFLHVGLLNAAIWKLPFDFIETCHRHFKEGTMGVTSECDQLIVKKPPRKRNVHQQELADLIVLAFKVLFLMRNQ